MAVVYKRKHHRNPSGLQNKIAWLLSESKRDIHNLDRIISKVDLGSNEQYESWYKAIEKAYKLLSDNNWVIGQLIQKNDIIYRYLVDAIDPNNGIMYSILYDINKDQRILVTKSSLSEYSIYYADKFLV